MAMVPALKDKDLCRRAKSGDLAACDALLEGAQTLIESRVQKVIGYGRWPPNVDWEDAEQEATEALLKALRSWDGIRPFTTLAVTCIDRALRRWRCKTFPVVHVSENVYSTGQYHEKVPLSLNATTGKHPPLMEILAENREPGWWGGDPLEILTVRCTVEIHRRVLEIEDALLLGAGTPGARHPRLRRHITSMTAAHGGARGLATPSGPPLQQMR